MWILLALVAAVCTALRDVASKRASRVADPVAVAFGIAVVPAVTLGAVAIPGGAAAPGEGFGLALAVAGGINALSTPLIVGALQRSDLSLVAPLTSLTPLFMLGTGALVLGEVPGPLGVAGVVVIVVGAWLLSLSDRSAGVLGPFRALLRDPGARRMLLVALLYSVSASYDKVGTRASSPLLWAASVHAVAALLLAPVALHRRRRSPGGRGAGALVLAAGGLTAVGAAAQMTALLLTLAAYVIAVKRISTLIGVLLGHSLFRESRVGQRLLGAAVMLAGLLLVTLG